MLNERIGLAIMIISEYNANFTKINFQTMMRKDDPMTEM